MVDPNVWVLVIQERKVAPGADINIFSPLHMWQEYQSHTELQSLRLAQVFALPAEGCVACNDRCDVSTCSSDAVG